MFVNALLDRILKSVRRYFRQEYSRRPHYRRRRERRRSFLRSLLSGDAPLGTIAPRRHPLVECLESRAMLTGGLVANNDNFVVQFDSNTGGNVLANDVDPNTGAQLFAHLVSGPSHANSFQLPPSGSFYYVPATGYLGQDSFTYYFSDSYGYTSNTATVSLPVEYSVTSSADLTKQVAIDPLDTSVQILGGASGAGGAPATPQNLSLAYDSVAGQPDAVIEATFQMSSITPIPDTPSATLTFNGAQEPATYVNLEGMGNQPNVDISYQVDTSGLATGRYAYSLTLNSPNMTAPATINGAVNVINDSNGPVGKGWDIPGLYHLYQNGVPGVPAGVLLTTGIGTGWYFTASGGSYTSPNGPFAFDTLTSVNGGGWQLVDARGDKFNFNSNGFETSRVARDTESDTYNWSGNNLVSIVDSFGRSVNVGDAGGQLSSVADFAGNVWTVAHSGAFLTSVTEPDPGTGAPVWQFGYTGNYLSSETDPNNNVYGFTLDSHHRLSGTSLPGGGSTSASSEQSMAYGGPTQQNAPNVTPSANVVTTVTDANNNTTSLQTDVFGNPLVSVDPYGNKTVWQRDANGLVTQLTEPPPAPGDANPVTTYSYDTMGNETSASGAHPTYGTYTFNTFGEWTKFVDSNNNTWTRSFDGNGNLLQTESPLLNIVSYTVDQYGQPLTMTTPAPNNGTGTVTTSYSYDSYERLTKTTWADNSTRLVGYDADDRPTTVTDENNHTTTTHYDVLGRITSVVNALNGVVSTSFDKNGNVLTTTDEMGNVTTNVWNARNELTKQTLPDPDGSGPLTSPVWQWTYDSDGNKLTQTDPMNRVTSWTWDKLDRMTQETLPDPDGSGPLTSPVIIIGYDNLGRKISEQDPLGTTTWAYGNTDTSQVTSMTLPDPDGSGPLTSPVWTYSYDTLGRRYKTVDPMNHAQTTSFDADGRTTSVLDNLGHGPTYTYGHMGELLTTSDSLNHTTTDQYDSRFRLVQTTDANGGITQIQLDPAGNRVGLIDPDNNKTVFVFDALNRETSETNALNFTRSFGYSASSDLTSETDRDGRVRNFVFDNLHRLITENWMNGGTVVYAINTAYDADNEVTSQSSPDSSYAFTFDNLGRTLSVDNSGTPNVPHVVLTEAYDSANDRTSLSATIGGTLDFLNTYTFDADQRLTDETQQGQNGGNGVAPKQIAFYYNALGQFTSIARYDFVGMGPMVDIATAAYSYDGANRMTNLAYTGNSGQISIDSFAFTLDNADRITARTSSVDGTVNYGYDVTNQVTSAGYTGGSGEPANESYSYSKNGNRTNTGYSTGTNNQLLSDGTFNYQYDDEGNRTVRTRISNAPANDYRTTYSWDYRNRLTDVEYFNNSGVLTKHVHYIYDSFDHEIGKQVDDTGGGSYDRSEWYVLDVVAQPPSAGVPSTSLADPLLQFDQNGNLTYRYFNGPTPARVDAVMGEEAITTQGQAGTDYWPLGDQVNTPHEVVNNASSTVDRIITNTFGVVTSESNTSIHHWAGFEGGHFDPDTALTNDDHRWYDPVVGRWISEDPVGFNGGDASIVCYVGNSPLRAVDPLGETVLGIGPQTLISMLYGSFAGHDVYTPVNEGSMSAHSSGTPINTGQQSVHGPTVIDHLAAAPATPPHPQQQPKWPKFGQGQIIKKIIGPQGFLKKPFGQGGYFPNVTPLFGPGGILPGMINPKPGQTPKPTMPQVPTPMPPIERYRPGRPHGPAELFHDHDDDFFIGIGGGGIA